ncbi:MAG: hypothetical protein M3P98_00620 [bacterium]|nr:hypothetical protein [bacterium]
MKIIGVGGRNRSGKDTIVELLIEKGWFGVSGGDIVREYSRKRHANKEYPVARENLTETANWLRTEQGPDVLLKEVVKRYKAANKDGKYKGLVSYSIRAPIEVDFILENGGRIIWVEASDVVRHARHKEAQREGESHQSLRKMLEIEALEEQPQPGTPAVVQMNIKYVQEHATDVIENNGDDLDAFLAEAAKFVENLL